MKSYKIITHIVFLSFAIGLNACSDDKTTTEIITETSLTTRYDVNVTNITSNQPLTPVAVIIHEKGYTPWMVGTSASDGLEMLAESGSPALFLQESDDNVNVITNADSGGLTLPGMSSTVSLSLEHSHDIYLSLASMLADTNDAFSGIQNVDIGELKIGESITRLARVYDAGTEANTEASDSIPGPSSTVGETGGFSPEARDAAKDFVSIHPGSVGMDELPGSALDESKRWLTYAALVKVTRTE